MWQTNKKQKFKSKTIIKMLKWMQPWRQGYQICHQSHCQSQWWSWSNMNWRDMFNVVHGICSLINLFVCRRSHHNWHVYFAVKGQLVDIILAKKGGKNRTSISEKWSPNTIFFILVNAQKCDFQLAFTIHIDCKLYYSCTSLGKLFTTFMATLFWAIFLTCHKWYGSRHSAALLTINL